jgi:diaminopimelate epimerase
MRGVSMKFTKMQGTGNDFIVIDCMERENEDLKQLAPKLCNRHFGIGADGIIMILPSASEDIKMRIINSDGSEAEMCGNGIRCFAKYVYTRGIINKEKIRVETLAGTIVPEIIFKNGKPDMVKVDMGEPRLKRSDIPMEGPEGEVINEPLYLDGIEYRITCVSMGNPHCVIFTDDVNAIPIREIGPGIENHKLFPQKTNVEFIQVLNQGEIKMKVWERGAGETLACGTGACASGVASYLNKKTGRRIIVHLPGGDLLVEWMDDNHIYMTGPAEEVFTGEIIL